MKKLFTRQLLIAGYVFATILIFFFATYTWFSLRSANHASALVGKKLFSLRVIEEVLDDVQDIEAGQRGYLIAGNKEFLDPYYKGIRKIGKDTADLAVSPDDSPKRVAQLRILQGLIRKKIDHVANSIAVADKLGKFHGQEEVTKGEGKLIMDSIRSYVDQIEQEDRIILKKANLNSEAAAASTQRLFSILTLIFTVFFIMVWVISRINRRKFLKYQDELTYLGALASNVSDAVFSTDNDFRIQTWNEGAEKLYGWSAAEAKGKIVEDLLRSEYSEPGELIIEKFRQTGFFNEELAQFNKKGEKIYVLVSSSTLINEDGEIVGAITVNKDVTRKKNLELELRRFNEELEEQVKEKIAAIQTGEERYRSMFGQASDGIFIQDIVGNYLEVNPAGCSLLGYTREEMLKMNSKEVLMPGVPTMTEKWGKELKEGRVLIEERLLRCRDGSTRIVEGSYKQLSDGRIMAITRDISERKTMEAALKVSEQKLRQIMSSITDEFYVVGVDFRFTMINEKSSSNLSRLWGKEMKPGVNLLHVVPAEKKEAIRKNFERVFKGELIEYDVSEIVQGHVMWKLVTIMPLRDDEQKITGAFLLSKDITERKKAEEEIVRTNARFQVVSRATSDIVWDWDLRNNTLWWNDNFYSILGIKKQKEIVPVEDWFSRIHPEDLERTRNKIENAVQHQETFWSDEYRFRKADGSYMHFLDRGYIMRDKLNHPYRMIGSMTDMTPVYLAQKELKESEIRLRTIIDSEPECIKLLDREGVIREINPAGIIMLGAEKPEQVLGTKVETLVHDEFKDAFFDMLKGVFNGESRRLLFKITSLQGEHRWLDASSVPLRDSEGNILSLLEVTRDVTEVKIAEDLLRQSEEKYRSLVDQADDAIALYDDSGEILDVNNGASNMLGYTKEELRKMDLSQILSEEDLRERPVQYELLRKGHSTVRQRKMIRKDGSLVITEVRAQQLPDGRFLSIIRDLTERISAQQEIEREKDLSDNLIDGLPGVFYFVNRAGKMLRWNKQLELVTGFSETEIPFMTPPDFFEGDDKQKMINAARKVFEEGQGDAEAEFVSKDGAHTAYYFKAIRVEYNGQDCLLGTAIDISDRKKAERLVLKERDLSDKIINNLPGVFYLYDKQGHFMRWNRNFEVLTGYSPDEIRSMHPVDFYDDDEKERIRQRIDAVFNRKVPGIEVQVRAKSGKHIPIYINSMAIDYEGRQCLMGMGIDVTERKKTEEELQESYRAVRTLTGYLQNIREQERAHMAREIHDELGQQLTVLKMDVSWLNKKIKNDEDPGVKEKIQDLLTMLDGTVKTVRRISSELRPSLLDDLGLVAAMEWQIGEFQKRSGIRATFNEPIGDFVLNDTARTSLFRIFQESLTNVARHAGATQVVVGLENTNGKVVLQISDDGKGFERDKITGKKTLGLLGMQERTLMMGGTYDIISVPGKGTTVRVAIPVDEL